MPFTHEGKIANVVDYGATLKQLRRAIGNKRRGLLSHGISLVYDSAKRQAARWIQDLIEYIS